MIYYMQKPDELYHYGVKGMKWGVRHDPERSGSLRGRYHRRAAASVQRDIDSFRGHENGIYTKRGRQVMSKKDVADTIRGLEGVRDKSLAKADKADLAKVDRQNRALARKGKQKTMSTAKKVAIGVGIAAAVGATAYIVVTKRNNRLARDAVSKALRAHGGKPINLKNLKSGPTMVDMEFREHSNGLGSINYGGKIVGTHRGKLTGHSRYRMTKTGQALSNRNMHAQKMDQIVRENARRHASINDKDWGFDGQPELRRAYDYHKSEYNRLNTVVRNWVAKGQDTFVKTTPINKLRRQRGPKVLRRH